MLNLYQSDDIEYLVAQLAQVYQEPTNWEKPKYIFTATDGMKRYINNYLAQHLGIATNIRYQRIHQFLWQVMTECLPDTPTNNPFSSDILHWKLMQIFLNKPEDEQLKPVYSVLDNILSTYPNAPYDIAMSLGKLFDQYLVYRPEWIEAWSAGKSVKELNDKNQAWQQILWQYLLTNNNTAHRVHLWQELREFLQHNPLPLTLPQKISIFAINAIAPMYLDLLDKLSNHCQIHLFLLNPGAEYWTDPHYNRKSDYKEINAHPLLLSLGSQSKDFFDSIIELDSGQGNCYFKKNDDKSLLSTLQSDIRFFREPTQVSLDKINDRSITIHSTHSCLRELQILKNNILKFLQDHPDATPQDIAVISPNIEYYLPFIDGIFGQYASDNIPLNYSISDTKTNYKQPYLYALQHILAISQSRFELSNVYTLLENEMILKRFDLTLADIPFIRHILDKLNIHWGKDEAMRQEFNGQDNLFTWRQGIDRIICGLMLPENHQLWQGISPFSASLVHFETLLKLCTLLENIFIACDELNQKHQTVDDWIECIQRITASLLVQNSDNEGIRIYLNKILSQWQDTIINANFQEALPLHMIQKYLTQQLEIMTDQGFLRGGITFCNMIPMRALPFRFLALIGMNDTDFPRQSQALPFDIMQNHPKKGDRSRRDDDRYLFLEYIISARDILYCSYIGQDIHTNEQLAPSSLLGELVDCVSQMLPSEVSNTNLWSNWVIQHPLHDFSLDYFYSDKSQLFSFNKRYAHIKPTNTQPFYQGHDIEHSEQVTTIHLADLLSFWRDPSTYWLRHHLGWYAPWHEAYLLDNSEPFDLSQKNYIYQQYYQDKKQQITTDKTNYRLWAESQFPAGQYGKVLQEICLGNIAKINNSIWEAKKQANQDFEIVLPNNLILIGSLNGQYDGFQMYFIYKEKDKYSSHIIPIYINHLIANTQKETITNMVFFDGIEQFKQLPENEAYEQLSHWVTPFLNDQPTLFFPYLSFSMAEEWYKKINSTRKDKPAKDTPAIMQELLKNKARNQYFGDGFMQIGIINSNEAIKTLYRDSNTPTDNPNFWQLTHQLLIPLFKNKNNQ